ncbi:MAG: monovalent cation/H+ antiporter complex subunit F [Actinomycetota bacterium]
MITLAAMAIFGIGGLCGAFRLVRGPGMADRVIALDVMLISFMGVIAVDAARRDDRTNLIILVVLAIIGFTATVAASRFLEHQADVSAADLLAAEAASSDDDEGADA